MGARRRGETIDPFGVAFSPRVPNCRRSVVVHAAELRPVRVTDRRLIDRAGHAMRGSLASDEGDLTFVREA